MPSLLIEGDTTIKVSEYASEVDGMLITIYKTKKHKKDKYIQKQINRHDLVILQEWITRQLNSK